MSRFVIVDLSSLFARARHVTQGDAISKAGMALHIVFRSIRMVHRDLKADHIVFAVDNGSWRYDVYPLYKAKRHAERLALRPSEQEENETFRETLAALVTYLEERTRCTVLNRKGVEADDFVARWVQRHPQDEHIIVSGDSDFVQLLATNVSLFDGVNDRLITLGGVFALPHNRSPSDQTSYDDPSYRVEFRIDSGSGKVKVPLTKGKPTFNPDFVPEPDWPRKSLFVKIVRGDSGDGIFSSYPGVSYKGSSKRVGIQQAWDDRDERGFHWNNFFLQTWQKADGRTPSGDPVFKEVRVRDEFAVNEGLIDLTRQPDEVVEEMDHAIDIAVSKAPVANVGAHFLKFCARHDLPVLSREPEARYHAAYLNAAYPRRAP